MLFLQLLKNLGQTKNNISYKHKQTLVKDYDYKQKYSYVILINKLCMLVFCYLMQPFKIQNSALPNSVFSYVFV